MNRGNGFLKLPMLGLPDEDEEGEKRRGLPAKPERAAGVSVRHGRWICRACRQRETANKGKVCTKCLDEREGTR